MRLGQGTPGQPKYQDWLRLVAVGRRPTIPLHNRLTFFDVAASHWLTMSVLGGLGAEGRRAARGFLLYI